jgi:hypothetical protein
MLKNGLFLNRDANAGDSFIVTRLNNYGGNMNSNDSLSSGEQIVITHAPQHDRSDVNLGWYYETHTILSVVSLGNDEYRVNLGRKEGGQTIVETLQRAYKFDATNRALGDGISKLNSLTLGPTHYFDASPNLVTGEAFLQSFTENIYLPDATTPGAMVPVPFLETNHEPTLQHLAEKWSSVFVNGAVLPNHQLLVIAADNSAQAAGTAAGVNISLVSGRTSGWVFRGTIEQQVGNNVTQQDQWAMKTAAHEIAHHYRPNGIFSPSDHCPLSTKAYNDPNVYCLLADHSDTGAGSVAQRTNGIARFHLLFHNNAWHSEYLGIRQRPDPFQP